MRKRAASAILRHVVSELDQNVGVYANVAVPGRIRTGDVVSDLDLTLGPGTFTLKVEQETGGGNRKVLATSSVAKGETLIDTAAGYGDGLSEELINQFAHIEGLRVTARTSAFSFKGKGANVSIVVSETRRSFRMQP